MEIDSRKKPALRLVSADDPAAVEKISAAWAPTQPFVRPPPRKSLSRVFIEAVGRNDWLFSAVTTVLVVLALSGLYVFSITTNGSPR